MAHLKHTQFCDHGDDSRSTAPTPADEVKYKAFPVYMQAQGFNHAETPVLRSRIAVHPWQPTKRV